MIYKTCSNCKLNKEIDSFSKNKSTKDGYNCWCKTCLKEIAKKNFKIYHINYFNKNPWAMHRRNISTRCTWKKSSYYKRGIKNLLSVSDVKHLWFRDQAYLMNRPSIDRINSEEDYTINNCRFIELFLNISLGSRILNEEKVIEIRDLHSKGVNKKNIAKEYGVSESNIGYILNRETWKHC